MSKANKRNEFVAKIGKDLTDVWNTSQCSLANELGVSDKEIDKKFGELRKLMI